MVLKTGLSSWGLLRVEGASEAELYRRDGHSVTLACLPNNVGGLLDRRKSISRCL